jgi:hypothetical protein
VKKVLAVCIVGAILAGAWFYWSPRAAARDLRDAAQSGDVEELQRLVDFPLVQEQLKADLKTSLLRSADTTGGDELGSSLATGFGGMIIDGLVNQVVSPSGIAALVRYGSVDSSSKARRGGSPAMDARLRYRDLSTFVITARHPDNPPSDTVNFVMRRRGLSWRLVRVILPRVELQ